MGSTEAVSASVLKDRFLLVCVSILVFLVLGPAVESYAGLRILLNIFLSLVFLATVRAVATERRQVVTAYVLLVPFLILFWLGRAMESTPMSFTAHMLGIAFLGYACILILRHVFRSETVTSSTIFAAVSVYLLIALLWSLIYGALEYAHPGESFNSPGGDLAASPIKFVYFSFVTLTTVGYGDITPKSPVAGGVAVLESVVGQIYLVVQVAWLVGMHVSEEWSRRT